MKRMDEFSGLAAMVFLLATFVFTSFRYFVIALSTGISDLIYFLAIWMVLIFAVRFNATIAYGLACVCGILWTFPLSLFVYLSSNWKVLFTDLSAVSLMIDSPLVVLWILEYVLTAVVAQAAMRHLWQGMKSRT